MANKKEFCTRGHKLEDTRKFRPNGDSYCGACKNIRTKINRKTNPEKTALYSWKNKLKSNYNLTENGYRDIFDSQDGKCAICLDPIKYRDRSTHIDHDHITLDIRGLLCHCCNTALGLFKDNTKSLERAIEYLTKS